MADKKINGSIEITGKLNPNSSGYGFTFDNTSSWVADKNIATTDDAALKVQYLTTAPTSANTDGLKFVVLSSEPATKYSGWLYFIL